MMATTLEELQVLITSETSGLRRDLNNVRRQLGDTEREVNKSTGGISSAMKKVSSVLAGVFAIKKVIDYGKASVQTYNEVMVQSGKLAQVMRNTMGATDDQIKGIKRLTQAQEGIGVIAWDTQMSGAQELGTYLENVQSLQTLIPTMNDMLAQQYGVDATSEQAQNIATMIGKVMDGQLGGLSRYGYSWNKAQEQVLKFGNELERAKMLAEVIGQSVGGMNAELAKTPAGQLKQLEFTFAGIREQIGSGIMSAVAAVIPYIQSLANWLFRVAQYFSAFMQVFFGTSYSPKKAYGGTATAIGGAAAAQDSYGDAAEKAGKKAKKAGEEARRSVAGFDEINLLTKPAESGGGTGGGGGAIPMPMPFPDSNESEGAFDKIKKKMQEFLDNFKEMLKPLGGAWDRLKQSIADLWKSPAMQEFIKWATSGWGEGIEGVILMISGAFDILAGAIDIINAMLNGDWKKAWEGVGKILYGFWEIITGVIGPLFPGLTQKMKDFGDKFIAKWDELKNINYAELFLKLLMWFTDLKNQAAQKWDEIKNNVSIAWELMKEVIKTKASEAWNNFKAPFEGAYSWFKVNVSDNVSVVWENIKTSIRTKASEAWNNFKAPFEGAYSWFQTNVVDKIANAFNSIKLNFTDGLYNSVKTLINRLIDYINKPLIDIKSWSFMGAKPFSGLPTIPKLAQGGYIGANKPLLAMIGDNTHEGEIVTPESKIYEQAFNAIKDALSINGGGDINLTVNLGGTTVFHEIINGINQTQRQAGKTLIEV
jgi:hypothetical protein